MKHVKMTAFLQRMTFMAATLVVASCGQKVSKPVGSAFEIKGSGTECPGQAPSANLLSFAFCGQMKDKSKPGNTINLVVTCSRSSTSASSKWSSSYRKCLAPTSKCHKLPDWAYCK